MKASFNVNKVPEWASVEERTFDIRSKYWIKVNVDDVYPMFLDKLNLPACVESVNLVNTLIKRYLKKHTFESPDSFLYLNLTGDSNKWADRNLPSVISIAEQKFPGDLEAIVAYRDSVMNKVNNKMGCYQELFDEPYDGFDYQNKGKK